MSLLWPVTHLSFCRSRDSNAGTSTLTPSTLPHPILPSDFAPAPLHPCTLHPLPPARGLSARRQRGLGMEGPLLVFWGCACVDWLGLFLEVDAEMGVGSQMVIKVGTCARDGEGWV